MCTSIQNGLGNVLPAITLAAPYVAAIAAFVGLGLHNYDHEDASKKAFQGALITFYTWVGANGTAIVFTATRTVCEGIKGGCEKASTVFKDSFKSGGLIRDTFMAPILPCLGCLGGSGNE